MKIVDFSVNSHVRDRRNLVDVHFTLRGQADFAALTAKAKIDVIHKLELIEDVGLDREFIIGEIAPGFSIYLLYAGHHHIAVACDGRVRASTCSVFAIEAYALIDLARKATFLNDAVRETGFDKARVIVFDGSHR